jgi:hypothetical protein
MLWSYIAFNAAHMVALQLCLNAEKYRSTESDTSFSLMIVVSFGGDCINSAILQETLRIIFNRIGGIYLK